MISVAIMAHRKRQHWVPDLQAQLGDCEVVWDRHNDRHETGLRSILAYDPTASHHLIVQDDALLCRDLVAGCERIAEKAGEHPVGLYVGQTGPLNLTLDTLMRRGVPGFVSSPGPHWGVAIMLPTAHIPDLAEWYEAQTIPNYDRRISRWYGRQDISCWYTAPSLVNHRHEDNPSLVGGRNGGRHAAWFIGENESALEVDLTSLLKGPTMATFRNTSTQQVVELAPDDTRFARINRMAQKGYRWERLDDPEPVEIETEELGEDYTDNGPAVVTIEDAGAQAAETVTEEPEPIAPGGVAAHVDMSASIPQILQAVGDDPDVAAAVLEAELSSENPRKGIVEQLGELLATTEGVTS